MNFSTQKNKVLNVQLTPTIVQGKEVVVTAQMQGQTAAINQQINSNIAVNVVSQDRIRELPDANAAESIGRLPGVSLVRDAGEASKVVIRGLEPKFNEVGINGVKIPSTSATDRSVDLSMISSESLEGIEVYKSVTPDMDATAVGGYVDLKIKKAPEERKIQIRLEPGFSQLKNYWQNYKADGEYSNRFFNNKFGLVSVIDYQQINRSSESFSGSYQVLSLRDSATGKVPIGATNLGLKNVKEIRKRLTGSLTFDYKLGKSGSIWLTNFYSSTNRNPASISKSYQGQSGIAYSFNDQKIEETGLLNSLNGEFSVADADMDWAFSRYNIKSNVNYSATLNLRQGTALKSTFIKDDINTYIPSVYDSIQNILLMGSSYEPSQTAQTNYSAKYNLKFHLRLGDYLAGFIKFGGKYLRSDRNHYEYRWSEDQYGNSTGNSYNIRLAVSNWPNPMIVDKAGRIMGLNFISSLSASENIVNNEYNLFPFFDTNILDQWTSDQKKGYNYDRTGLINNYDLTETVSAGYLMTQMNLGQLLTVIGGARYEYSNNRYQSIWTTVYEIYGRSGIVRDTTLHNKYGHWYPGIYLKFKAFDWLSVLTSANRSLARPDYIMIEPYTRFDQSNAILYRGNPDLKNQTSGIIM